MASLLIIIIIFVTIAFPILPFSVLHLPHYVFYGSKDLYRYIKYKRWREFKGYGKILTFNGLFGAGKTLSTTHYVSRIYKKYDGVEVYDFDAKKWVTQHIHIVSNYHFTGIPYTKLVGEYQLINFDQPKQDVTIFVLDEIGAIFNNRDYKSFTPDVLTSMLQCRHRKAMFIGTSQRFQMQDKNFRITMEKANQCKKVWRIVKISTYDAYQLENCNNPTMLKPLKNKYWFCYDRDYNAYDTNEMVCKLLKDAESGKLMTSAEITEKQGASDGNVNLASSVKKRYVKRVR